jgi:hypothetical protein|tara:strand:+ start:329 stop:535 length:207 start_codon:yes stop_codon:yes gene_type:complete
MGKNGACWRAALRKLWDQEMLQERAGNLGNAPMQNGSSDGEAALDQQKQNQDNKKINVIREKCKDDHQ